MAAGWNDVRSSSCDCSRLTSVSNIPCSVDNVVFFAQRYKTERKCWSYVQTLWASRWITTVRAPRSQNTRERAWQELLNCTQSCSCPSCHSRLQCSCSMFACNQSRNQTYTVSERPVGTPSRPTGHSHPTRRPLVNLVCRGFSALTEGDRKASSNIWLPARVIRCEDGSLHVGRKGCYISDTRGDDRLRKDVWKDHVTGSLQTVRSLRCAKILDYDGNRGKICYLGVFKRSLPKLHCN